MTFRVGMVDGQGVVVHRRVWRGPKTRNEGPGAVGTHIYIYIYIIQTYTLVHSAKFINHDTRSPVVQNTSLFDNLFNTTSPVHK